MNTLQCEMCVQLTTDTVSEPATSLLKANEAAEMMNPVYIHCVDCKQYLCKRCDYRAHTNLSSEKDEESRDLSNRDNEDSEKKAIIVSNSMTTTGFNQSQNQTQSSQVTPSNLKSTQSTNEVDTKVNTSTEMQHPNTEHPADERSTTDPSQSQPIVTSTAVITEISKEDHERIQICEECAEKNSTSFCPKCEQALCEGCWSKIHNKGARTRHKQKKLQKPKYYSPNTWKKGSIVNQQSAGSSSYQDSMIQFNKENVLDEIHGQDEKDGTERSALLNGLEVQLVDRGFHHMNQQQSQMGPNTPLPMIEVTHPGIEHAHNHPMQQPGQGYPYNQRYAQFGQSHQYNQAENEFYSKQQNHGNQMAMNAAPFHPGMHNRMTQQQYNHQHQQHPGYGPNGSRQGGYYIYPEQQMTGGPYPGYSPQPYGQHIPHYHMPPGMYQQEQIEAHQQKRDTETRDKSSLLLSQDDSLSSGIFDEARHQVPSGSNEETGYPPHAAFRHHENSEPHLQEQSELRGNTAFHDNLNSAQSQKIEPYAGSAMQIQKNRGGDLTSYDQIVDGKDFTPLRKGPQDNKSEFIPSPLMNTPNEQLRVGASFKNSKFMTPPLPMGGQSRTGFKIKSGANAQTQYVSRAKPSLKVPRHNEYAQGSMSSYSGKPPIGTDKKGPHIQYQAKTGKPNSMSSHEMNSDNSGDNIPYSKHNDQKSIDSYQLYHQSNAQAKNNPRSHVGANQYATRKTLISSHNQNDYSPRSQHSSEKSGYDESRHDRKGQKMFGSRRLQHYDNQNSSGVNSYYEKQEYKFKVSGNDRDRMLNSSSSYRNNDSRGSASKPGSLSNYKSGSGGNQSSNSNTYYNERNQRSSAAPSSNSRAAPTRTSHHDGYHAPQRLPVVPIIQPVIVPEGRHSGTVSTRAEENDLMAKMQHILFENAALGDLLILKSKFVEQMQEKMTVHRGAALKAIDRAVNYGIVHQTDRNFANAQKIEFISLKIQVLSHQCLQWIITSLRRDEMTPIESAIKNRTKEAFDFKLQNDHWDAIMKSIQTPATTSQQRTQFSDGPQYTPKRSSITDPDKGSSAHTTKLVAQRGAADSSFSSSQASSVQQQTETTVSAQGITKIMKIREPDTGSGSQVNSRLANNSSGGEPSGSEPATDSHGAAEQSNNSRQGPSSSSNSNEVTAAPRFKVVPIQSNPEDDSSTGVSPGGVYAIYMVDEEVWTGVDIEDDTTVDRDLYVIMKEFLRDYFCAEDQQNSTSGQGEEQKKNSDYGSEDMKRSRANSDDYTLQGGDLRMIPGGRYGCTQFLKICGPEAIRKCSVGKTTQMVQLAIKEDVLRHLKTQIVWSTQVDKHKTEQDQLEDQQILILRKAKLEKVKEAIIEILAESKTGPKTGMSLAQLPQYLKKKLPFNLEWNELGFPKLKDLLKSMTDQIKVELRDVNHPFAYLVQSHKPRTNNQSQHQNLIYQDKPMFRDIDHLSEQIQDGSTRQMVYDSEKLAQLVQVVFTLLQVHPQGIKSNELKEQIQSQIDFEFTFSEMGCGSEYEFVQKYIMPEDGSIEFITLAGAGQKTFTIRSKKIFGKFFDQMVKADNRGMFEQKHPGHDAGDEYAQKQGAGPTHRYYPSSRSLQNFARGPKGDSHASSDVPSDIASEFQPNETHAHQQRLQTQPNDHTMPTLTVQQAYFATCESIHGSDTQSCGSSLHHQVREFQFQPISDLSIDLDLQKSQQSQKIQTAQRAHDARKANEACWYPQTMPHHGHYPWQPPLSMAQQPVGQPQMKGPGQQFMVHQGYNNVFDNLKINSDIQGNAGMTQTPYSNTHMMIGNPIPIDAMDQEENQRQAQAEPHSGSQPQHNTQEIFYEHNFGENDSPRVQGTLLHLFDESSPAEYPHQYYNQQLHNQNPNATATDFENQSISVGILNQSIFSEGIKLPTKNLNVQQADGHKSFDINAMKDADRNDQHEEYFPLLRQQDDQQSSKTWQPNTPVQSLDFRQVGSLRHHPAPVQIPHHHKGYVHNRADQEEQKRRITEETSGSHHSSPPKSPDQVADNNSKPQQHMTIEEAIEGESLDQNQRI